MNQTMQWDEPANGVKEFTEAQLTRREAANQLPVLAGGARPENFAQLMDYAQMMSRAQNAIPAVFHNNVGACLAVMEVASQFGMPYFAVARQSYFVNGQIAFMGQLVHAIIRLHAPIKGKPTWRFEGDGDTLKIFFSATFKDDAQPSVYESPAYSELPVKNSPLWKSPARADREQQFIYLAARRWVSRYWPEGMLGVYVSNEFDEGDNGQPVSTIRNRVAGDSAGQGLLERLRGGLRGEDNVIEGFAHETAAADVDRVARGATEAGALDADAPGPAEQPSGSAEAAAGAADAKPATDEGGKPEAPAKSRAKAAGTKAKPKKADLPKTAAEWDPYCRGWIGELKEAGDAAGLKKRWADEQKLRNACGVTSAERDPVFEVYMEAMAELEPE